MLQDYATQSAPRSRGSSLAGSVAIHIALLIVLFQFRASLETRLNRYTATTLYVAGRPTSHAPRAREGEVPRPSAARVEPSCARRKVAFARARPGSARAAGTRHHPQGATARSSAAATCSCTGASRTCVSRVCIDSTRHPVHTAFRSSTDGLVRRRTCRYRPGHSQTSGRGRQLPYGASRHSPAGYRRQDPRSQPDSTPPSLPRTRTAQARSHLRRDSAGLRPLSLRQSRLPSPKPPARLSLPPWQ